MKLVLIGIVGAGKSTQGNLLSKQLKIPYLSTGHIFREIAKEKTTLGRKVKTIMASGWLIPDDLTIEIVEKYLSGPEYKRGYILDGFPRTLEQVKKFKNNIDKIIYLEIPEKEALWRLTYRNEGNRTDDTVEAVRRRIEVFHKQIRPVIQYYEKKGKLVEIDGTKSIEGVNEDILKNLGKQLVENQIKEWKKKGKSLIAIVGLAGSGKTEAAEFFRKEKKLPVVAFGKIVNEYVDRNKLTHDEETHKKLREGLRQKHGMAAFALLNKEKIEEAFKKNDIVIVDGLQSWEEYTYLKNEFPKVRIYLLALFADKKIRYRRSSNRKYRTHLYGEERDVNELVGADKGPAIAYADFLIKNNFSLEDLHDKLENVYRVVYFS